MQQQVFSPLWIWRNPRVWHRQHTGRRCPTYPKLCHRWKWWIGGGPRIKPWGTPALMNLVLEDLPFKMTFIERFLKQSANQWSNLPAKPRARSLTKRPGCHTLSNALLMSRHTNRASSLSLMALERRWAMYVRASEVEWPALKPNCRSEISLWFSRCFHMDLLISFSMTSESTESSDTGRQPPRECPSPPPPPSTESHPPPPTAPAHILCRSTAGKV